MQAISDKIKFKSKKHLGNHPSHDWEIEFFCYTYPEDKCDRFLVETSHVLNQSRAIYQFTISNEIIMWMSHPVFEEYEDLKKFVEDEWKKIYKLKHFL